MTQANLRDRLQPDGPSEAIPDASSKAVALPRNTRALVADRVEAEKMQALAAADTLSALMGTAKIMRESGLAPWDNDAQGAIVLMQAVSLGIPVAQAVNYIDVIEKRPRLRGKMIAALVERSGVGDIHIIEYGPKKCVGVGRRGDRKVTVTKTVEDFAHLKNSKGWSQYPSDMLAAKVQFRIGGLLFADVIAGMDVTEGGEVVGAWDEGESDAGIEWARVDDDAIEGTAREVSAEPKAEKPAQRPPAAQEPIFPDDVVDETPKAEETAPGPAEAAVEAEPMHNEDGVEVYGVTGETIVELMSRLQGGMDGFNPKFKWNDLPELLPEWPQEKGPIRKNLEVYARRFAETDPVVAILDLLVEAREA